MRSAVFATHRVITTRRLDAEVEFGLPLVKVVILVEEQFQIHPDHNYEEALMARIDWLHFISAARWEKPHRCIEVFCEGPLELVRRLRKQVVHN